MKIILTSSLFVTVMAVVGLVHLEPVREADQVDGQGMTIHEELTLDRMFIHGTPIAIENILG